jgi:hypothetical protein
VVRARLCFALNTQLYTLNFKTAQTAKSDKMEQNERPFCLWSFVFLSKNPGPAGGASALYDCILSLARVFRRIRHFSNALQCKELQ